MRTLLILSTLAFLIAPTASALSVDLNLGLPEIPPFDAPDATTATGAFIEPAPLAPSLPQPTSLGQAIVGFHDAIPAHLFAGGFVGGLEILTVEPRISYLVVRADDLDQVRAAFTGVPGVAYIEDDQVLSATATPNDSRYGNQYGPAQMGAEAAWDIVGYGSSDIIVAVLDTGIRSTHEDLAANFIGGYDYVNNDNNPNDDCGHGTHVSGTVAAVTNNGKGVAGVSQASIIHHKVLGPTGGFLSLQCSGSSSDINAAILDAADAGAHIISMSLGGGGYSSAGDSAVNYATNQGSLVVAAAGNDGQCSNCVGYPAAYANSVAVASLTSSGAQSSFSSSGPEVEISAGGSDVESTYNSNDQSYSSMSGTSMATPHVAGALALALSCDPSLTNNELRTIMQQTAQDLGPSGRDTDFGFGLLRVDNIVNALGTCGGSPPTNQDPTAAFTIGGSDLTVSVDGSGSSDNDGNIASYAWNFGDGATATGATASHTYAADGTYTISLTVTDDDGATDATSQSVTVSAGGPPPGGCGAGFGDAELADGEAESISVSSWSYRQICVPDDATSITISMTGPGCGLTGCSFDADMHVKDGSRASSSNYDCRPYNTGNDETCTLSVSGGWVSIAINAYSGSGTVTLTADHNGAGTPPPPTNDPPTASFTASCNDLACSFSSTSTDPDGDSLSASWTFGDGGSATGSSASHTYAGAGTYTVTLTVNDGNGHTDSASQSVTVTAPPPPTGCTDNGDGIAVLDSGASYEATVNSGQWAYGKICAADGDTLDVAMTGPSCGLFGCSFDADLYVREGAAPTTGSYDCRPYASGSDESCSLTVAAGWVYIGVNAYSGSGTVDLTATLS